MVEGLMPTKKEIVLWVCFFFFFFFASRKDFLGMGLFLATKGGVSFVLYSRLTC